MATPTYTLIDSEVLASSASSVTFGSLNTLAAGYKDLVLALNISATATAGVNLRVNSDAGSNYNYVWAYGNGSVTGSSSGTLAQFSISPFSSPDTTFAGNYLVQFFDFSVTDKHKSILSRSNNANSGTAMYAGRWANTAAITSVEVFFTSNQMAVGSTLRLFGIAA